MKTAVAELGDKVEDRINGFTGIVVAITDYLYGCKWVLVESETKCAPDGKQVERWLDELRVKPIKKPAKKKTTKKRKKAVVRRHRVGAGSLPTGPHVPPSV